MNRNKKLDKLQQKMAWESFETLVTQAEMCAFFAKNVLNMKKEAEELSLGAKNLKRWIQERKLLKTGE